MAKTKKKKHQEYLDKQSAHMRKVRGESRDSQIDCSRKANVTENQKNEQDDNQPQKRYRCFMHNPSHKLDWFSFPVRSDGIVQCPECKCKGGSDTFERKYREWARDK